MVARLEGNRGVQDEDSVFSAKFEKLDRILSHGSLFHDFLGSTKELSALGGELILVFDEQDGGIVLGESKVWHFCLIKIVMTCFEVWIFWIFENSQEA